MLFASCICWTTKCLHAFEWPKARWIALTACIKTTRHRTRRMSRVMLSSLSASLRPPTALILTHSCGCLCRCCGVRGTRSRDARRTQDCVESPQHLAPATTGVACRVPWRIVDIRSRNDERHGCRNIRVSIPLVSHRRPFRHLVAISRSEISCGKHDDFPFLFLLPFILIRLHEQDVQGTSSGNGTVPTRLKRVSSAGPRYLRSDAPSLGAADAHMHSLPSLNKSMSRRKSKSAEACAHFCQCVILFSRSAD